MRVETEISLHRYTGMGYKKGEMSTRLQNLGKWLSRESQVSTYYSWSLHKLILKKMIACFLMTYLAGIVKNNSFQN